MLGWKTAWSAPVVSSIALASLATATTLNDFENHFRTYQADGLPVADVVYGGPPHGYFLRLTTGGLGIHNSAAFDRTDPGPACGFSAEFDFRIAPAVGRADGLGFALADVGHYGPTGPIPPPSVAEEPNLAASLGVGFDIHQGTGELNANHVSVHYDGAIVPGGVADAAPLDLASGTWIHASISLTGGATTTAQISVTLTPAGGAPTTLFDRLPIPDFVPYEGRVYLAGRTGGQSAVQDVDNVAVTFTACPPARVGRWEPWNPSFGIVPIHALMLPTRKVLFWDRHDYLPAGTHAVRSWDTQTGEISLAAEPGYDIFCAGHSALADGRVLVTGGHVADQEGVADASAYDPFADEWVRYPDMSAGRWYPTNATLANGDVLVVSGNYRSLDRAGGIRNNDLPEVLQMGQQPPTWRPLTSAVLELPLYPFLHLAPNGKVFCAGPLRQARYLDTSGTGAWSDVATSSQYRDYGSSVMYLPGRVLITGGTEGDQNTQAPTRSAEQIDLGSQDALWQPAGLMGYPRRMHNSTLLADGSVLVTGGSSAKGFSNTAGAVLAAELWDPQSGAWTTLAGMQNPRLYHSTALLLPDGRVLSAGGGHPSDVEDQPDAEIYSPPYLFRGPRPEIRWAPSVVGYGQSFEVATPDAGQIGAVTWLRLSSVTHGFDQDQRFDRLSFTASPGVLHVTAPASGAVAPPGYYMLFILSGEGVPSQARFVRLQS